MRLAFLLAALSVLPIPAYAQANQSFVQGFGGLRLADAPSLTPTAGGTVGVGLTPHIQVIGEVGHISDVLPSTIETLMTVSPVTVRRSALYGEGGVRLNTGPAGHLGVYGETLFGAARLNTTVSGLGSARTDAIANLALRFVNTTSQVGAIGTGVILQGGPVVATLGYRYTRFFSDNMLDTLLSAGHSDVNEARVSFGFRF
jgi:Outer membrane protein beta-barrel domain